jgi:hypothetical protein
VPLFAHRTRVEIAPAALRGIAENVNQNPTGVLDYGIEVSEARRLKSLEDENRRLKKLLAEAMLDNAALKDLLGKNG